MGKPEGIVENYLFHQAKKHGFLCYKFTSPGHRGVPDRIVIGRGHTVFIELKAENGHLSELQKVTIASMKEQGADVRVYYSKSEIDEFFKEASKWRKSPKKACKSSKKPV